jgi:hypothetical protein
VGVQVRPQEPVKIARIGLVLEMVDGSKVMVYADGLHEAQVTLTPDMPMERIPGESLFRPFPAGPSTTSILIEGIGAHKVVFTDPNVKVSVPGRELEAMRRAVQ